MLLSRRYIDEIRDYDICKAINKIKIPFLYYNRDKDQYINVQYAYKAHKYFKNNGKIIIIKNSGHILNYRNEDRLFNDIINFILKNKY